MTREKTDLRVALSGEAIAMLSKLAPMTPQGGRWLDYGADSEAAMELVDAHMADWNLEEGYRYYGLTFAGEVVAATLAEQRKELVKTIADDLEDAATDCDGHTPYSILMALSKEVKENYSTAATQDTTP